MPLLVDYAITPDVLDESSYSNASECEARLDTIREVMLNEGLVRDLRDGAWQGLFLSDTRPWHRRGLELVKKLQKQGRLVRHPRAIPDPPEDDGGWCTEALATHRVRPLSGGVIVTERIKKDHPKEPLVARIDRLSNAPWWAARSPSVTLTRTPEDYKRHLDPVLRHANLLVFIDPHLAPEKPRYREFGELLAHAGNRRPAPRIEIHRVCYEGSGDSREFPMRKSREAKDGGDPDYFKRRFRAALGAPLRETGLNAEVFIWDDFHDRYLISNIIGISLQNGFDTTTNPNSVTRWGRLGRDDRDGVRREFNRAGTQHKLADRFRVA